MLRVTVVELFYAPAEVTRQWDCSVPKSGRSQ